MIYTRESMQKAVNLGREFEYYCYGECVQGDIQTCLSNRYLAPFSIDTIEYGSVEQFIQAQKAMLFTSISNTVLYNKIVAECQNDPEQATKYGDMVQNIDQRVWDRIIISVLYRGILAKFTQNKDLGDYLLSTGDKIIVCYQYYDSVLGVKLKLGDARLQHPEQWRGENKMGFLLMNVRDFLHDDSNKTLQSDNLVTSSASRVSN